MAREQVKTQVLLLHSEQSTLDNLSSGFSDHYTVHCATSGTEALDTLGDTPIHVIVSAQSLPGMSGIEALREAKKRSPDTIGILLAGQNDHGLEALVGDKEVFQIVRGGVSAEEVSKLVDNATQQMRLLALAESANDMAANPDEPVSEHIVMETSENGSTIISDGTGTVPILDPQKIASAASAGANTVDVLVLTKDDEFLATVKESSRGMHNIRFANTLAQAEEALVKHNIGVAVVDAAMVGGNVEKLTEHLRGKTARLVNIVAGRRDDGEMLMDLINRGKVYRFLLKPVSPGRARLAVEASVKHHLEAPESAFKINGPAVAPKPAPKAAPAPKPAPKAKAAPAPKPQPKPAAVAKAAPKAKPKAKPKAAPKAQPKPAPKAQPKPAPKPTPAPQPAVVLPQIEITPSPEYDRLGAAFDGDDSSFTETMTGIVANIGEKFGKREEEKAAEPTSDPTPAMSLDSMGGSPFSNPRILGISAVAIVAVASIGFWIFGSSDESTAPDDTVAGIDINRPGEATSEAADPVDAQPEIALPESMTAEEIDLAIATAEAAMLDRRSGDAAAELAKVSHADPDNARLPFLTAQVSQMQLREYLDSARAAIRDTRLEDAASTLRGARGLDVNDTTEIDIVDGELQAARNALQVEDVLAKAVDRLEQGMLLSPANDNAGYYYEIVLNTDPGNMAAQQGLTVIASKLVLQARTEIDAGRFDSAATRLGDARRLDPNSNELASATRALSDAVEGVAEADRRVKAAAAAAALATTQRAEAERVADAKRIEDQRLAAERQAAADRQAEIDRQAAERQAEIDRQAAADKLAEDERLAAIAQQQEDEHLAAIAQQQEDERLAAIAQQQEDDRLAVIAQQQEDERLAAIAAAAVAAAAVDTAAPDASPAGGSVQAKTGPASSSAIDEPIAISALTRIKYVAPRYPRSAERRNLSGWVDIVFTVATDGTTKNIEIRDSEPGKTFVNAATKAVAKWQFMPVFDNGIVVDKRAGVRMMFELE